MSDYINRQEILDYIKQNGLVYATTLETWPAADVLEVVRGEWVFDSEWWDYVCTNCRGRIGNVRTYKFCPNCGADMRGNNHA